MPSPGCFAAVLIYAVWAAGVYHSGVEINGVEYAFGGHEGPQTGIWNNPPRQAKGRRALVHWTVEPPPMCMLVGSLAWLTSTPPLPALYAPNSVRCVCLGGLGRLQVQEIGRDGHDAPDAARGTSGPGGALPKVAWERVRHGVCPSPISNPAPTPPPSASLGGVCSQVRKNCNHFSSALCMRLVKRPIPGWINRLADLGAGWSSVFGRPHPTPRRP